MCESEQDEPWSNPISLTSRLNLRHIQIQAAGKEENNKPKGSIYTISSQLPRKQFIYKYWLGADDKYWLGADERCVQYKGFKMIFNLYTYVCSVNPTPSPIQSSQCPITSPLVSGLNFGA